MSQKKINCLEVETITALFIQSRPDNHAICEARTQSQAPICVMDDVLSRPQSLGGVVLQSTHFIWTCFVTLLLFGLLKIVVVNGKYGLVATSMFSY